MKRVIPKTTILARLHTNKHFIHSREAIHFAHTSAAPNQNNSPLNFDDTGANFSRLPTSELLKSYVTLTSCQIPLVRNVGPTFLDYGGPAVKVAAKYTYFKHFCGGENLHENASVVQKLHHLGIKTILDYSVEGSVNESGDTSIPVHCNETKENDITKVVIDSISFLKLQNSKLSAQNKNNSSLMAPCPMAVVKLTGISDCNLLMRMSEILSFIQQFPKSLAAQQLLNVHFDCYASGEKKDDDMTLILKNYAQRQPRTPAFVFADEQQAPAPLNEAELLKWKRVLDRMDLISAHCRDHGVTLLIDAEQSWVQPAIDLIAMYQSLKYNLNVPSGERPLIHNTYQLYLKDAFERLQFDHEFILNHVTKGKQGVKLVRGAYMQSETKRCSSSSIPYPFNKDINETHRMYHNGVDFTLNNIAKKDNMAGVVASHNPDTLVFATNLMKNYGLTSSDTRVLFAQLYGMGDSLTLALSNNQFNIAKYVPFGPVHEVLPYLSRRLVENSDMLGGSAVEIKRLKGEICSRMPWGKK